MLKGSIFFSLFPQIMKRLWPHSVPQASRQALPALGIGDIAGLKVLQPPVILPRLRAQSLPNLPAQRVIAFAVTPVPLPMC